MKANVIRMVGKGESLNSKQCGPAEVAACRIMVTACSRNGPSGLPSTRDVIMALPPEAEQSILPRAE
jgi:hypothetical protein